MVTRNDGRPSPQSARRRPAMSNKPQGHILMRLMKIVSEALSVAAHCRRAVCIVLTAYATDSVGSTFTRDSGGRATSCRCVQEGTTDFMRALRECLIQAGAASSRVGIAASLHPVHAPDGQASARARMQQHPRRTVHPHGDPADLRYFDTHTARRHHVHLHQRHGHPAPAHQPEPSPRCINIAGYRCRGVLSQCCNTSWMHDRSSSLILLTVTGIVWRPP